MTTSRGFWNDRHVDSRPEVTAAGDQGSPSEKIGLSISETICKKLRFFFKF